MLTRRHLRIKALQAIYAFMQSQNSDLAAGEKQLVFSVEKIHELFYWLLSLLVELNAFARIRIEEGKKKFFPTEEDMNPNTRFIDNRLIAQIERNKDYNKRINVYKISWADEHNLIHHLYQDVKKSPSYTGYISAKNCFYKEDKEIIQKVVVEHLTEYELLRQYFEDRSIYWADGDYEIALFLLYKTISLYQENWTEEHHLPGVFKINGDDDDRSFMLNLFRKTILHSDEYEQLIDIKVQNWELERIAVIDMIILKMALAEILEFPTIPLKVTMNEYIELSKAFSSEKSKLFVNGMLDKLTMQLNNEGRIRKIGRGLLDH